VEKVNVLPPHDRNDSKFGRALTRRRWPLKSVAGGGEGFRAVDLELVPDAIREFIGTPKIDAKKADRCRALARD
jgi:hypothetical protein